MYRSFPPLCANLRSTKIHSLLLFLYTNNLCPTIDSHSDPFLISMPLRPVWSRCRPIWSLQIFSLPRTPQRFVCERTLFTQPLRSLYQLELSPPFSESLLLLNLSLPSHFIHLIKARHLLLPFGFASLSSITLRARMF